MANIRRDLEQSLGGSPMRPPASAIRPGAANAPQQAPPGQAPGAAFDKWQAMRSIGMGLSGLASGWTDPAGTFKTLMASNNAEGYATWLTKEKIKDLFKRKYKEDEKPTKLQLQKEARQMATTKAGGTMFIGADPEKFQLEYDSIYQTMLKEYYPDDKSGTKTTATKVEETPDMDSMDMNF